MRKLFGLMLLLLVILAACGGGNAEPEAVPVENQPAAQPAVAEPVAQPTAEPTLPPPVIEESGGAVEAAAPVEEMTAVAAPWPADQFGYGIQVHGDATVSDQGTVMDAVKNQLGMDWVKTQIRWNYAENGPDEYQWFFYDATINEAAEHGLYTMVSVVASPDWARSYGLEEGGKHGPPDNYQDYYDFLRVMLERYDGKIQAVEVWNEQNLDREWLAPNGLSAADYTAFLQGAYETIKSVNPDIIVISGALSPTGGWTEADGRVTAVDDFVYFDQMIQAGFLNYADCVGVHHNGINLPPDVAYDQTGTLPEASTASFRGPYDNP
ncbi:MAG: cellulase family glycosylhydrolase, partial [Anaerolineales bacterium]|nr:cellulase family glycosylhydrolase [Anaerolineales bacterium]